MKRLFKPLSVLTAVALLTMYAASAQGVNKSELQSVVTNPDTISFINYTGPHAVISTAQQIRGIGESLAEPVASDTGTTVSTGDEKRYQVLHIVDPAESGKLDADILILGDNAGVDHIKNLRRIISGFLTDAYGYSTEDADTLAVFITVYNAVNRGSLSSFDAKYKKAVVANLTASGCGLSVNWEDWAGKTQLVIPLLTPVDGGLSTIDTTTISDKQVISNLREETGRGVEERKNLVDLKERESSAAYEDAKEAQITAVQAAEEARQADANAEEQRQALVQARIDERLAQAAAREAEDIALATPDDKDAQENAAAARDKALEASQKSAEAEQKYVEEVTKAENAREVSREKSEQAATSQQFADKKNAETQSERIAIAQDQQKNLQEEAAAKKMSTTWALQYDAKAGTSSLIVLNTANGKVVKMSPVTDIRSTMVYPVEGGFIAVAGRSDKKNSAVKLVIIDDETMEIIAQSNEILSDVSALVQYKNLYYGILRDGKKFYVACWKADMTLSARSSVEVVERTPVIVSDKGVAVTTSAGAAMLLTVDTLEEIK